MSITWSDSDLDRIAALTLADVAPAQAFWRKHARKADRTLLDTGSDDERRLSRALDGVIASVETEMDAMSDSLAAGRVTVADWQMAMADMLRMQTMCAIACGRGSWSRITVEDLTSA